MLEIPPVQNELDDVQTITNLLQQQKIADVVVEEEKKSKEKCKNKKSKEKTRKPESKSTSKIRRKKKTVEENKQEKTAPIREPEPESEDTRKEQLKGTLEAQVNTTPAIPLTGNNVISKNKLPSLKKRRKSTKISENVTIKETINLPEPGQEEKMKNNETNTTTQPTVNPTAASPSKTSEQCESVKSVRKSSSRKSSSSKKKKDSQKKVHHCCSEPSTTKRKKKRSKRTETNTEDSDGEEVHYFPSEFILEEGMDKHSDFVCLTEADIIAEQNKEISEVSEVLSVSSSAAITLLKYFKWDRDRLMTSYFDNPNGVLQKAGVGAGSLSMDEPIVVNVKEEKKECVQEEFECSICVFTVNKDEIYEIAPCGHSFCLDCWDRYLTLHIAEGQAYINCPHINCLSLVQEPTVKAIVSDDTYKKYCQFFMKSFVEDNDKVKWCPAPGCGNAVTSDMIHRGATVQCHCGYRFCFKCSEEAHQPATCEQIKLWKKKCQDESETNNWIAANTQECPKCQLPTEKNGGCNHMVCRQCKHEYCWVCAKEWKGHNNFYTCNRYQKSKKDDKKSGKKSSRKERELQRLEMRRVLEKYLHYYSRFMNHTRSSELEKIREKAISKMQEMQETEATSAEVLFIKTASDQLVEVCFSHLKSSIFFFCGFTYFFVF